MKKFKIVTYKTDDKDFKDNIIENKELLDVICDICQKSCKTHDRYGQIEAQFDFLEIKGSFGYYSKRHDCESWEGQICEDCSENTLDKIICFTKKDYMNGSKSVNDELNLRSNRIRKIRKLTGKLEFTIN